MSDSDDVPPASSNAGAFRRDARNPERVVVVGADAATHLPSSSFGSNSSTSTTTTTTTMVSASTSGGSWTTRVASQPEFLREPAARACWRAIDPTGSREPEVARTMQCPEEVTAEGAGAVLSALLKTWLPTPPPPLEESLPFAYSLLGLDYDPFEPPTQAKIQEVKAAYNRVRTMLASLIMVCEFQGLPSHDPSFSRSSTITQSGIPTLTAFQRLSAKLKLCKTLVLWDFRHRALYGTNSAALLSEFAAPWEDYVPSVNGTALLASAGEESRNGGGRGSGAGRGRGNSRGGGGAEGQRGYQPHQAVIIGVLQDLKKNCLCLMDGDGEGQVWQQVLTSEGRATRAYKPKCKMVDYVREWSKACDNTDRWKLLTNSGWTEQRIADHLLVQPFDQFLPRRKMGRSVWSFRNGIFKGDDCSFLEYATTTIPEDLVACKYSDLYLDPEWIACEDVHSIAFDSKGKPLLSSIQLLQDQGFSLAESDEIHGMLGRCLFPIGLYDKMDSMLAFIGQGGTGKSSIINGLKMLFPKNYVRAFSGKEKEFGMDGCENAWLVVTTEITPQLMNQIGEILQWIAGESVAIARKNKGQLTAKIRAHLVLCGNSFNLKDVGGNINRRTVVCQFDRKPLVPNTQLKQQQRKEMARFLVYIVRQYHALNDRVGKDELIRHLQPKFRTARREIISQVNPIISFLHRDNEVFTTHVRARFMQHLGGQVDTRGLPYLPFETFMQMIKTHAARWSLDTRADFTESSLSFAFDEYGLYKLAKATYYWWDARAFQAPKFGSRAVGGGGSSLPDGPPTLQEGSVVVGVGLRKMAELYRSNELCILDAHMARSGSLSNLSSASSSSSSSLSRVDSFPNAISEADLPICQPKP